MTTRHYMSVNRTSDLTDSSIDPDELTNEERSVQNITKSMLQGRMFIGTYQENRYVESLSAYRDVVTIDRGEKELIPDLGSVKKRIRGCYGGWIGITSPEMVGAPAGYCLWVEMEKQTFGKYWFKVKSVKFRKNEVLLRLKIVRNIESENAIARNSNQLIASPDIINMEEMKDNAMDLLQNSWQSFSRFFYEILTIKNTKEALVFLSVLTATIFTGSIQFFQYLADYSLKLMREMSIFVKTITPILIAFINMVGRCIGGLYYLILLLWRNGKAPNKSQYYYIDAQDANYAYNARPFGHQKALRYRQNPKDSVHITELN